MNKSKPTWADYANLASNVAQNVQLQEAQSALRAMGALQAKKSLLELNEQQARENEDQLRDHIWQAEQSFQKLLCDSTVTPCTTYVVARQALEGFTQNRVASSFRQFADKDRVGQFITRIQQAVESSASKMTEGQKKDADTYLRYEAEAAELASRIDFEKTRLSKQAANEKRKISREKAQLKKEIKENADKKIADLQMEFRMKQQMIIQSAAKELESLRREARKNAASAVTRAYYIPRISMPVSMICWCGSVILAWPLYISVFFGITFCLSLLLTLLMALFKSARQQERESAVGKERDRITHEMRRIEAEKIQKLQPLEKNVMNQIGKILTAADQEATRVDGQNSSGERTEGKVSPSDNVRLQQMKTSKELDGLLQQHEEREVFIRQFRQVCGLLPDGNSGDKISTQQGMTAGQLLRTTPPPTWQSLARDPTKKLEAIKLYREQIPGIGLAEAKAAVEAYSGSNR